MGSLQTAEDRIQPVHALSKRFDLVPADRFEVIYFCNSRYLSIFFHNEIKSKSDIHAVMNSIHELHSPMSEPNSKPLRFFESPKPKQI